MGEAGHRQVPVLQPQPGLAGHRSPRLLLLPLRLRGRQEPDQRGAWLGLEKVQEYLKEKSQILSWVLRRVQGRVRDKVSTQFFSKYGMKKFYPSLRASTDFSQVET